MSDTDQQPAPDLGAMVAAMVERLRAEGTVPGIPIGERAPTFSLPDAGGSPVSLDERLGEGPVVLSFYRGAWCPICNTELAALQEALPQISALGARLIAVSPQAPDASGPLVQRLGLAYDVLSDLDQSVIRDYRLQFALDEDLRAVYRGFNIALDEQNADSTWNLPVPATFILDQDGIVRARHVDPNYRNRMPVEGIVATLADLPSQRT